MPRFHCEIAQGSGEQDMDRTTTSGTVHIAYARALLDHLRAAGTDPARL